MDNFRGARNSTSKQNSEELISAIEKYFGFKKKLIKNLIQHGKIKISNMLDPEKYWYDIV